MEVGEKLRASRFRWWGDSVVGPVFQVEKVTFRSGGAGQSVGEDQSETDCGPAIPQVDREESWSYWNPEAFRSPGGWGGR